MIRINIFKLCLFKQMRFGNTALMLQQFNIFIRYDNAYEAHIYVRMNIHITRYICGFFKHVVILSCYQTVSGRWISVAIGKRKEKNNVIRSLN